MQFTTNTDAGAFSVNGPYDAVSSMALASSVSIASPIRFGRGGSDGIHMPPPLTSFPLADGGGASRNPRGMPGPLGQTPVTPGLGASASPHVDDAEKSEALRRVVELCPSVRRALPGVGENSLADLVMLSSSEHRGAVAAHLREHTQKLSPEALPTWMALLCDIVARCLLDTASTEGPLNITLNGADVTLQATQGGAAITSAIRPGRRSRFTIAEFAGADEVAVVCSPHDASVRSVADRAPPNFTANARRSVDDDTGAKLINQYLLVETLGQGTSGKVKLAYDTERNTTVAMKILRRQKFQGAEKQQQLQREIAVMKRLRHKNLVSLYEVIDDPHSDKLYLVMQYVDDGPFLTVDPNTLTCKPLEATLAADAARQICAGLAYLHSHHIVHRDIKPENILKGRDGTVYLCDFGLSEEKIDDDNVSGWKGSPLFMAPEVHALRNSSDAPDLDAVNGYAADIYSLGVTLSLMLTGKMPFCTIDDAINGNHRFDPSLTTAWRALLREMIQANPTDRPDAAAVRFTVKGLVARMHSPSMSALQPPERGGSGGANGGGGGSLRAPSPSGAPPPSAQPPSSLTPRRRPPAESPPFAALSNAAARHPWGGVDATPRGGDATASKGPERTPSVSSEEVPPQRTNTAAVLPLGGGGGAEEEAGSVNRGTAPAIGAPVLPLVPHVLEVQAREMEISALASLARTGAPTLKGVASSSPKKLDSSSPSKGGGKTGDAMSPQKVPALVVRTSPPLTSPRAPVAQLPEVHSPKKPQNGTTMGGGNSANVLTKPPASHHPPNRDRMHLAARPPTDMFDSPTADPWDRSGGAPLSSRGRRRSREYNEGGLPALRPMSDRRRSRPRK